MTEVAASGENLPDASQPAEWPGVRKVLVLGFSVTEQHPGFVDAAKAAPGIAGRFAIEKVAIGGCQPKKLKFILADILATQRPDIVVLEIGTFGFAGTGTSADRHPEDVMALLHDLACSGAAVGFLDLPRKDHPEGGEWVLDCHAGICRDLDLPYRRADLIIDHFKDIVHPTPEGAAYYGRCLVELLTMFDRPEVGRVDPSRLPVRNRVYAMLPVAPMADPGLAVEPFQRAGYQADAALLPACSSVRLTIPESWAVCGLGYIIGPRSGPIQMTIGSRTRQYPCSDQFAYYQRASFTEFEPVMARVIEITQLADLPEIEPVKGERNVEPRLGKFFAVLVQRPL